jgi:hypothetical protein
MSSLEAIGRWEPIIGSQFITVGSAGPSEACAKFEHDKDHLQRVFDANFCGDKMANDHLAPALVKAFRTLWAQLPKRGLDFNDQNTIMRILYTIGSHARFVREVAEKAHVQTLSDRDVGNTKITFRDSDIDADLGVPGKPGTVVERGRFFASAHLDVDWYAINMDRFRQRLHSLHTFRVGHTPLIKGYETEGFYAGRRIEPKHQPKGILTEEMGRRQIAVDKHTLGVDEYRLEFMGWEDADVMPVLIMREVVDTRGGCAITLGDLAGNVPVRKQA